jgi:rubredoxin
MAGVRREWVQLECDACGYVYDEAGEGVVVEDSLERLRDQAASAGWRYDHEKGWDLCTEHPGLDTPQPVLATGTVQVVPLPRVHREPGDLT